MEVNAYYIGTWVIGICCHFIIFLRELNVTDNLIKKIHCEIFSGPLFSGTYNAIDDLT